MEEIHWERIAAMLFCFCVGAALLFFLLRYALPLLLPFLIAWAISVAIRPLAQKLSAKLPLSQKWCSVLLLLVCIGGLVWLIWAAVNRLCLELGNLLEHLLEPGGELERAVHNPVDYFETLTSGIGFLRRVGAAERYAAFRERFNATVSGMLESLLNALCAEIPTLLGGVISSLPAMLLVTVMTVLSGFYFCLDGDRMVGAVRSLLPAAVRRRLPDWKRRMRAVSWKYARAYFLLLVLTFAELFIGFCILRVEYAFLLAFLIALVDLLPVLGVGTVLIPWAVVLLFQKNFYLGFGLLILYVAVTVFRQIAESRLVGQSLGLHPFLTLFATYVGWRVFGLPGMIAGPFFALLIKTVLLSATNPDAP